MSISSDLCNVEYSVMNKKQEVQNDGAPATCPAKSRAHETKRSSVNEFDEICFSSNSFIVIFRSGSKLNWNWNKGRVDDGYLDSSFKKIAFHQILSFAVDICEVRYRVPRELILAYPNSNNQLSTP